MDACVELAVFAGQGVNRRDVDDKKDGGEAGGGEGQVASHMGDANSQRPAHDPDEAAAAPVWQNTREDPTGARKRKERGSGCDNYEMLRHMGRKEGVIQVR